MAEIRQQPLHEITREIMGPSNISSSVPDSLLHQLLTWLHRGRGLWLFSQHQDRQTQPTFEHSHAWHIQEPQNDSPEINRSSASFLHQTEKCLLQHHHRHTLRCM